MEQVRIDKWLWAVRAFKTRTMASQACDGGKVKIAGDNVKPARQLKVGEEVQFTKGQHKYIYKVVKLIERRVGAPEAQVCYEDITPQEWKDRRLVTSKLGLPQRDKGDGRPTKKQRRDMDKFRGNS